MASPVRIEEEVHRLRCPSSKKRRSLHHHLITTKGITTSLLGIVAIIATIPSVSYSFLTPVPCRRSRVVEHPSVPSSSITSSSARSSRRRIPTRSPSPSPSSFTSLFAVRGPPDVPKIEDVEVLLEEVEQTQSKAFRDIGVLGKPLPPLVLEKMKTEGRLGTGPEKEALKRARDVEDREGREGMLEALKLRAMAKRLRAEADLAEMELANERLNATVRAALEGIDIAKELIANPRGGYGSAALDVARMAFSRILGLEASQAPPLSTVEKREVDQDEPPEYLPGTRPTWVREEDWDDDLPDLSLMGGGKRKVVEKEKGSAKKEDAALMRVAEKELSARVQDDFMREAEAAVQGKGAVKVNETSASSSRSPIPKSQAAKPKSEGRGEDETYYNIGTNASDVGIIAYELVANVEAIPGLPDVKLRRIKRRELDPDESFQRAFEAIQKMIESEGEEGAEVLVEPVSRSLNFTNMITTELNGDSQGRVKDGLLEAFLQSNFPDEDVEALPEATWQTLRSDVFGKTAGGAFKLSYVVDFDSHFHVLVGDVGTTPSGAPLSTHSLSALLDKRLEYFNLSDTMSLFLLRFPPETLFELEDIAMDAALDQLDATIDDMKVDEPRGPRIEDDEDLLENAGLDLRLMGELVPRFIGKLAQGRFAILALSKQTAPEDTTVLDDPIVKGATLGMGALLQTAETLRYVAPPLFERLDQDLVDFLQHASEFPAVTLGVPAVLAPFAGLIVAHEAGHWLAAKRNNVKLGSPVPVLDPWLGYLGSLTPLKSYPPTRQALFDVAAAGPLLGSLTSYIALGAGLWLTKLGMVPDFAPSIPLPLLQASIFIAEITNAVLPGAFAVVDPEHAALSLHPLALAGYWGIVFNALNLLPLGRLDGGRMVEALLGKRTAAAASVFTFWGTVAAGIWQNRIDLLFAGLVIRFFWHRKAVPCRDEVADVGGESYFLGVAGLILLLGAFIPASTLFAGDAYLLNNL